MTQTNPTPCPRFPLQTLYNTRDLGGYRTRDGRVTICGRLIRADAPVRLNAHDLQVLLSIPVHTVVDLRSLDELRRHPHSLRNNAAVSYRNIPLLGDNLERDIRAVKSHDPARTQVNLVDLYLHLLENARPAIGMVLNTLAAAGSGACLFNCTHGKDRTGLIAALLLLLAGVAERDIIEDYQISAALLKPWFDTFLHKVPAKDHVFFISPPEHMALTLEHLQRQYDSVERYLHACGVDDMAQHHLRNRLLVPA
jgi:protein-tyrosine phosphatase